MLREGNALSARRCERLARRKRSEAFGKQLLVIDRFEIAENLDLDRAALQARFPESAKGGGS
jgi:hypothetical protein